MFVFKEMRHCLHVVAKKSSFEELKSLLDQGCEDLDSRSGLYNGKTALHLAVLNGSEPKVRLLLDRGASINLTDNDGNTALHMAFSTKNKELVELLLEKGADFYCRDENGNTPLHIAVHIQFESGLQTLLEANINTNIKNDVGLTPLHIAVYNQSVSTLNALLAAGCDPNMKGYYGQTPLHLAVYVQFELGVKTLLAAGVDTNIKDDYGRTPLLNILELSSTTSAPSAFIAELLAWGAAVEVEDSDLTIPQRSLRLQFSDHVLEHFTKIKCANLSLDIEKHKHFSGVCSSSFEALCFDELKRMKAIKFGRFPLNDIFAKYSDPLYCLNEELVEATKPNSSALDSEFPLYAPLLRARFFKAKQRLVLLNEAQSRVPFNVPEEIKRNILSFIDSKDLDNVVKAFGEVVNDLPCP